MTSRRRPALILILALAGLTACGDSGGTESCGANEGGSAWPGDVGDAIDCDFGTDVRRVFVRHYALPDDTPLPVIDRDGLDEREARIAQKEAMDAWTAAREAQTIEWEPDDERCQETIGGHVQRLEMQVLGQTVVSYTCIVEDADIPALNALTSVPA